MPTMKRKFGIVWGLVALAALGGCALRPPFSSEEVKIDSEALPLNLVMGGAVAQPFCLHVLYRNAFYVLYSDTRAEAWVTDGSCASEGKHRTVSGIKLSWHHDAPWDTQVNRQCLQTDTCRMNEQNIIEGKNIRCAAALVVEGNQSAFVSTDLKACR
jgi:hypothetical protein